MQASGCWEGVDAEVTGAGRSCILAWSSIMRRARSDVLWPSGWSGGDVDGWSDALLVEVAVSPRRVGRRMQCRVLVHVIPPCRGRRRREASVVLAIHVRFGHGAAAQKEQRRSSVTQRFEEDEEGADLSSPR